MKARFAHIPAYRPYMEEKGGEEEKRSRECLSNVCN